MDYQYPLLQKVFKNFKNETVKAGDFYLVCCQHILEPQLKMFKMLIESGFNPEKIIVLGKVYSTNKEILSEMNSLNIRALQPEFTGNSFDGEHADNCRQILDLVPADSRIMILDDGAELIKVFANAGRNVAFAVEQTSSGFRKLENDQFKFPIINVARSVTKLTQESPLVAHHCYERVSEYLLDKNLINPTILMAGLGPIGEAVLEVFEENSFVAYGIDKNRGDDFLKSVLDKKPDIIIGATGASLLSMEEIEQLVLEKPLYLISVSSSDREFPVSSFREGRDIHQDVCYKNITFVNNGFPITFEGNRNELTPIEMEKTICLLAGSVLYGLTSGFKTAGLVDVPKDLESLIN